MEATLNVIAKTISAPQSLMHTRGLGFAVYIIMMPEWCRAFLVLFMLEPVYGFP